MDVQGAARAAAARGRRLRDAAGAAWRVLACSALVAQGAGAALWWWASPRGYPAGHAQWWANEVVPWALVVAAGVGVAWVARRRELRARLVVAALGLLWAGVALGGLIVFPQSGPRWAVVPALLATLNLMLAARGVGRPRPSRALPFAIPMLLAGGLLCLTQRAGPPDTRPAGEPVPRFDRPVDRASAESRGVRLVLDPRLDLISVSPDRCWTLFAPRRARSATSRGEVRTEGGALLVDVATTLDDPVYTHLNAFSSFSAFGKGDPFWLTFSPCPEVRVDVLPADYPFGRPMSLAYLDAEGTFHVVTATSGEKGPFVELARGPLARGAPLTITIHAGDVAVFDVTFEDWSAQVGAALSPTAGWGLPVNAIEFKLEKGYLDLWLTLAGTSVGRGWQSVGHAAGTYRNRVRIRPR